MQGIDIKKEIIQKENGEKYNITRISPKKIKWNININQKAILENGFDIDLIDATIFSFIADFILYGNPEIHIKNNYPYYWISYQYIIDALPLIKINNKNNIKRRIDNLVKNNLLNRIIVKENGNKTYFCIGTYAKNLYFGVQNNTESRGYLLKSREGIYSRVERVSTQEYNNSYINDSNINSIYSNDIKEIINYLNVKCNTHYSYKNSSYNKHIIARRKEGFIISDFKKVIDNKLNDEFFQKNTKYYNPETLFRPSNFEKYLNEKTNNIKNNEWSNQELTKDEIKELYGE